MCMVVFTSKNCKVLQFAVLTIQGKKNQNPEGICMFYVNIGDE